MEERVNSQDDLIGILSQRLIPSRYGSTILFDGIELYNDTEEPIEYNLFTILESLGMLKKNSDLLWIGYGAVDFKGLVIGDNISFICENFIFEYNILNIEYLLCQDLKFIHCLFSNAERIFTSTTKKRKCNISFSSCEFQSNIQINVPCKKLILSNCQYNQYIALSKKIDNLELDNVDLTKMIFDKFKADNISLKNMHTNSLSITSEKDTNKVANLVLSDKKLKTLSIKSCHFTDSLKIQNILSIETLNINNITGAKISLIDSAITLFDYVDNAERSDKTPQQKIFEFNNTPIQRVSFLGVEDQSIVFSDKESTEGFYIFFSSDFNQIEFIDFKNKKIQSISLSNSTVNLDFQNLIGINQIICNNSVITHNKDRVLSNLKITNITLIDSELKNTVFNKCEFTDFILKKEDPKISKLNNCQFNTCKFKGKVIFTECTLDTVFFYNSIFKKDENDIKIYEVNFDHAIITDCDFSQTEFHQKANFKYAHFHKENIFQYTEFQEQGAFYGANFHSSPTFNNLILGNDAHLYFEGLNGYHDKTKKAKRTQIDLFSFTNTVINGRLDFSEDTIKKLDLQGSSIIGTITRRDFRPECANWETATLFKHEELKIDNLIRALEYKAEEKNLYENELLEQIFQKGLLFEILLGLFGSIFCALLLPIILPLTIIKYIVTSNNYHTKEIVLTNKSSIKLITEWLSLWIGKVSNNHGQSWVQGIIFTTTVWFVCFRMFFIWLPEDILNIVDSSKDIIGEKSFYSCMIEYFNPTNYELLIKFFDSSVNGVVEFFGAFWFLLGKALVPYGIFEVVQAFRKYNKID